MFKIIKIHRLLRLLAAVCAVLKVCAPCAAAYAACWLNVVAAKRRGRSVVPGSPPLAWSLRFVIQINTACVMAR